MGTNKDKVLEWKERSNHDKRTPVPISMEKAEAHPSLSSRGTQWVWGPVAHSGKLISNWCFLCFLSSLTQVPTLLSGLHCIISKDMAAHKFIPQRLLLRKPCVCTWVPLNNDTCYHLLLCFLLWETKTNRNQFKTQFVGRKESSPCDKVHLV